MNGKLKTRLYCEETLAPGAVLGLEDAQAHYLLHTLRGKAGEHVALFNARDGEWCAMLTHIAKKSLQVTVAEQLRKPVPAPDHWLVFAPLKNEKIDYTVKRATELGAAALLPVMTARTIVTRVNSERLRANAIEAAEQCDRTDVPELYEPQPLTTLLGAWDTKRTLLFCDESGGGETIRALMPSLKPGAYAVLIGPEGGFSPEEQKMIRALPFARGMSLGPRILRAETAALAALAHVSAWLGDGDVKPSFEGTP